MRAVASWCVVVGVLMFGVVGPVAADPPSDAIRYSYDADGRLSGVIDPGTGAARFDWDAVGNMLSIERWQTSELKIVQLTPQAGKVGAEVSIEGTGFDADRQDNTVEFDGEEATVVDASETELVVEVPAGATSGPVTVEVSPDTAASPDPFDVIDVAEPSISTVSPTILAQGDVATLTGTNFEASKPANSVTVNRTRAAVTAASSTSLGVQIPAATGSGHVSLTTVDGSVEGPYVFIPPATFTPSDVAVTGTITPDVLKNVTISTATKIAMLAFDGDAGQRVSLQSTGSGMAGGIRLYGPDNQQITSGGYTNGTAQFIDTQTLPVDGTYTVLIDPTGSSIGSVSLDLREVPPDVTEELAPTDTGDSATLAPTVAGQNLRATFAGTTGQRVFVMVADGDSDRVQLVDPDGTVLASNPIWVYNTDAYYLDTVALPSNGTYEVRVDPRGPSLVGSAITVYAVPTDDVRDIDPVDTGDSETFNLKVGQRGKLRFEGEEGQQISAKSSATSIGGSMVLRKDDDGSQLASAGLGVTAYMDPVTLPEDGDYTLEIDPSDIKSGAVTITVYDFPGDVVEELEPTSSGDSATLTPVAVGQNLRATFEGDEGDRVFVKVANGSADRAKLRRPDGSVLAENPIWVSNTSTYYLDTRTLPVDGEYTVSIDLPGQSLSASTITVYAVPAEDARSVTPVGTGDAETFNLAVGQTGKVTFSGTSGQRISVHGSNTSMSGPIVFRKPDGSQLASGNLSGSRFIEPVSLPTTGTYTVSVDPSNIQGGAVTLTVYDVPADITEEFEPVAAGDTATLTPQAAGQNLRATFDGTAGQRIFVTMTSGGAWQGKVIRPDGSAMLTWPTWVSNTQTYYHDTFTLPSTGEYAVTIDPPEADLTGTTITIYDVPSDVTGSLTPTVPGDYLDVTTGLGQGAALTFAGTSANKVAVTASPSSIGGSLAVNRPNGSQLGSTTISNVNVRTTGNLTLPDTGTYAIKVNPSGLNTGTVRITLYDKTGLISAPLDGFKTTWASYTSNEHLLPVADADVDDGKAPRHSPRQLRAMREAAASRKQHAAKYQMHKTKRPQRAQLKRQQTRPKAARKKPRPVVDRPTRAYRPSASAYWRPAPRDERAGGWVTDTTETPWDDLPAKQAPAGETALAGQVLKVNGMPLRGAKLRLEGQPQTTTSDRTGRFLIHAKQSGDHVLSVTANHVPGTSDRFGSYQVKVKLDDRHTTVLDEPIWLTALDPKGDVTIPTKTKKRTVLTNPKIPGFEIRIPAGSEIRDRNGKPVHELNLTAVPLDRPPFPLPHFDVPAYFTIQPAGAYLSKGARVIYPNYMQASPKQKVQFWNYDAEDKGWHVYGYGRVSDNAKQMIPDPGVRIWNLTGAMVGNGWMPPPEGPGGGAGGGDPVDLATGLFIDQATDLEVPDVIPAVSQRTYRPGDTSNQYSFGIGTTSFYDTRVWANTEGGSPTFVEPDGSKVEYERINPEADEDEAVYEPAVQTGKFAGSRLERNEDFGFDLRFRDGTVYVFGNYSPLIAIRDAVGNQLTIDRNGGPRGRAEQVTTPNGRWIRFTYNQDNRIIGAIDNAGRSVSYSYDQSDRLETITDADGGVSSRTYDGAGQMTSLTDPRGITYLENDYDSAGRVIHQELADGGEYDFDYDIENDQVEAAHVTNPRGVTKTVTFANKLPMSVVLADGEDVEQETTYQRDPSTHQVEEVTDSLGRSTTIDYDSSGNVEEITELAGTDDARTTTVIYDENSRITHLYDEHNHTTIYDYDGNGRLRSVEDPTGRTRTLSYSDTNTRPSVIEDAAGKEWEFDYNGFDLVASRDPLGHETRYDVDAAGRTTRTVDPLGAATYTRYDDRNHVTRATQPTGATTNYSYDANGNPTAIEDGRGNDITATYDDMDQLESFTDQLNRTVDFEHDLAGNLTEATDRKGQITSYDYDELDRRIFAGFNTTGAPGSEQYESTIAYSYDDGDRLTEAADSANGTVERTFDDFDHLLSEETATSTVSYEYDELGRRTLMAVPDQDDVEYTYDNANRLTDIAQGLTYVQIAHDAAGRRSELTLPNGMVQAYSYDNASRLVGIDYQQGGISVGGIEYAYDAAGRRTKTWGPDARTVLPDSLSSATYDAANQVIARGVTSFSYDANGNLTDDGDAEYVWNARNQLQSTTRGLTSTSFTYDPFGRRQTKTSGGTTAFVYDRHNVVQERQSGVATADLLIGLDMDEVFARDTSAGTDSYLTDALGSTVSLVGSLGWPASTSYSYTPFGKTTATGTTSDNPYQYTGRENDGTELYYYRARYYSPEHQRFLSEDPLGLNGGTANFFQYANNRPTELTDPTGLFPWDDLVDGTGKLLNLPDRLYWAWDCGSDLAENKVDECDPVEFFLGNDSVENAYGAYSGGRGGPGGGGGGGGPTGGGGPGPDDGGPWPNAGGQ